MKKKYFTEEEKREARKLEAKRYYDKFRKKPLSDEEKELIKKDKKEKRKEYEKQYYKNNREKILEKSKQYFKNNQKEKQEKNNKRYRERWNTDPVFKLKGSIKRNVLGAIKRNGFVKKSKTQDILGCTFEEFKQYIESLWEDWMRWDNHGLYNGEMNYGWDLDHIIPQSSVNTEEELIKLNHYTNYQPLCSKINRDIKRNNLG